MIRGLFMYGLTLDKDNRVLAVGIYHQGFPDDVVVVETLPDGNHMDYLYVDGQYVYDPLPEPEQPEATTDDVLNALLGVTV
jgi:hypothetical protein